MSMKFLSRHRRLTRWAFAACLCSLAAVADAQTTKTWSGSSTQNNRWGQADNWTPSGVPVAGDNLVFGDPTLRPTANHNLNISNFNSVTFTSAGFTVGPQTAAARLVLGAGGITVNASVTGTNTYRLLTFLDGPRTVANHSSGSLLLIQPDLLYASPQTAIENQGHLLTLEGAGPITFATNAAIRGGGGLDKKGSGTLTLLAQNTYTGPTTVTAGRLAMSTVHSGGGAITVNPSAVFAVLADAANPPLRCSSLTLGTEPGSSVTNEFIFGSPGNPNGPAIVATNLITRGTVYVSVSGADFSFGQFPLIQYEGSIGGDGFTFVLNSLPAGMFGYVTNSASSIELVLTPDPQARVTIENIAFHKSTHSLVYDENTSVDNGGAMFVTLRNHSAVGQTIASLLINGVSVTNISSFRWWRVWPETIAPGGWATITVKANGGPLTEGANVTCHLETATGLSATESATLTTPKLRLGSIVPSQDRRSIYLYLRNLDTAPYTVESVHLNEDVTGQSTVIGGETVPAKAIGIVRVDYAQPQNELTGYAVRVVALRGGQRVSVAAPVRLVDGWFPIGTWDSSMYDSDGRMQFARSAQLDAAVGVGTGSGINTAVNRYFIRAVNGAGGGDSNPNPPAVGRQVGNPNFQAWLVADEPDLSTDTSTIINARELEFRRLDATHPTYVNLASNRKFNQYGHIPDIIGMDHYGMFSAPNIIPGTHVSRHARLEEALEYTDVLKENTEPKRMWPWVQGVAQGTWSTQPTDWGIAIQYWMAMLGGAKGYFWFNFRESHQAGNPAQFDAMLHHTRLFSQVRNLVLYGEVIDNVTSSHPDKLVARAIVGEQAVVVPVINLNYSISGFAFSPSYSIAPQSGQLSVPVPAWLEPLQQVYEVTTGSNVAVPFTRDGNRAVFNVSLGSSAANCAKVFVLGNPDTQAPAAPSRLNVAERPADHRLTLSWAVPFDNFGVKRYRVFANGVALTNVESPCVTLEFADAATLRNTEFTVLARDSAGNSSPHSAPARVNTWRFDNPGYTENWIPNEDTANVTVADGAVHFDIVGDRPRLQLEPVRIDGSEVSRLQIRLGNGTTATDSRLFWATEAETSFVAARSVVFTVQSQDGEFRTYEADLSGNPAWTTNIITRLRFEGPRNVRGTYAIDWMTLTPPGPTNTPPVAHAQAVTTIQGQAKVIVLSGADADGDPLTFSVVTPPANGALSGTPPDLVYTPAPGYSGLDSFTFQANDGQTNSAPALVSITVWADSDGDGIPDWWMQQYFGYPTGQENDLSRAGDDADFDGMTNWAEWLAGTVPTNALSNLRITGVSPGVDGWAITWSVVGGKSYVVEASSAAEGGFTNISPVLTAPGSGESVLSFSDDATPPAGAPMRVYRVRLVPQP